MLPQQNKSGGDNQTKPYSAKDPIAIQIPSDQNLHAHPQLVQQQQNGNRVVPFVLKSSSNNSVTISKGEPPPMPLQTGPGPSHQQVLLLANGSPVNPASSSVSGAVVTTSAHPNPVQLLPVLTVASTVTGSPHHHPQQQQFVLRTTQATQQHQQQQHQQIHIVTQGDKAAIKQEIATTVANVMKQERVVVTTPSSEAGGAAVANGGAVYPWHSLVPFLPSGKNR